jgi:hypothetical protein
VNPNDVMIRTVDWAVDWALGGPIQEAIYGDVVRAVNAAVYWTVYWIARGDPPHPSLPDFLSRAGAKAP